MGALLSIIVKIATTISIGSLAYDLYNQFFAKKTPQRDIADNALNEAFAAGLEKDDFLQMTAASRYEQVENEGKDPDSFWGDLTKEQQDNLKFSPESLRRSMDRTTFLGYTAAILFAFSFASGIVGRMRAGPIMAKTISDLAKAKAGGAGALDLMVIIEKGKILGLQKVWTPGLVAALAAGGAWLGSTMVNNMNDVDLWGRINLRQAEADFTRAQAELQRAKSGSGGAFAPRQPVTRITMAKTQKPVLFLGTLFSSRVKNVAAYERTSGDQIDNKEELQGDAQTELNRWLATLPGRLIYTISISINPFDENGVKQTGTWAVLNLGIRNLGGKFTPLDTILLGPVDPTVYYPKSQEVTTIQQELPKLLTAEQIAEVQLPTGDFKLVDKTGNLVPAPFSESRPAPIAPAVAQIATPAPAPFIAPAPAPAAPPPSAFVPLPAGVAGPFIPAPTPAPIVSAPSETQVFPIVSGLVSIEDYQERGLGVPPGVPSRTFVESQKAIATKPQEPFAGGPLPVRRAQSVEIFGPQLISNFRDAPNLKGAIIQTLPRNTFGIIRNYAGSSDNFHWYAVEVSGRVGFIAHTQLRMRQ